ncbi:hypothetical protein Tco_0825898 [Tanacetum coccineum]
MKISYKKKELLPFSRFTKLIIKHILSKNNNVSKRLYSYQHVIKLDVVLGNLKFANNGAKDPIYGMAIPLEMMSNEVKAFADYLDYLAKSKRETPVKVRGKDSEDTKDKEEIPLIQRQTGVVIGRHAHKDSDEHDLDHSKKLKGIETLYEAAQFMINMKKLRKASKDDFILQQRSKGSCKGSGVILEVPDESSDRFDSSSSESEDQERFLTTDDDKSDTDAGKTMGEEQDMDEQARTEYGNQFINDNPHVSITDVLKEPVESEVQSLVDVPKVDRISKIDHSKTINKSVQAHLKKVLLTAAPRIGKLKPERAAKQSMPKKDSDASSSKKSKDKEASSKKGKALSKSSKSDKIVDAEATVQDATVDDEELAHDDAIDAEGVTHNDAAPIQDRSKWFKQVVVERLENPDPEWHKEPTKDDAPGQNWFNEIVNAEKDLVTFDDLMSSTVDFTKFAKICLKKDNITKADLEGPAFNLLKGN